MRQIIRCHDCGGGLEVNKDNSELTMSDARAHARKRGWLTVLTVVGESDHTITDHCPMHWPGGGGPLQDAKVWGP